MALRIVFFDCDGTLTPVKSSWQYVHERLGLWDGNADEFQRLFRAGAIDYAEFCRRDALMWKGVAESQVREIMDEIPYHKGVRETLEALRKEGVFTAILSTGLSLLVERVKRELGLSFAVANELVAENGAFTGDIRINVAHDAGTEEGSQRQPSCDCRHKGYWVRKVLADRGLTKEESAAVGDGEGDRGMFEEAGLAIGYHPSVKATPFLDHALHNGSFLSVFEVLRANG